MTYRTVVALAFALMSGPRLMNTVRIALANHRMSAEPDDAVVLATSAVPKPAGRARS